MWLLGCWVNVKMSPSLRPSLYRTLLPILHPREDLVVREQAACCCWLLHALRCHVHVGEADVC